MRQRKSWASSVDVGALKPATRTLIGLRVPRQCLTVPSLPAASMPCSTTSSARLCSAISIVASSAMRSARLAVCAAAASLVAQAELGVGLMRGEVDLGAGETRVARARSCIARTIRDRAGLPPRRAARRHAARAAHELDAVAERVVDEGPLDAREPDIGRRRGARRVEPREQRGQRARRRARSSAGWAFVAGANGSATPTCSWRAPQANQQPPRPASAAGFASSGSPSSVAVEGARLLLAAGRRRHLHVVDADDRRSRGRPAPRSISTTSRHSAVQSAEALARADAAEAAALVQRDARARSRGRSPPAASRCPPLSAPLDQRAAAGQADALAARRRGDVDRVLGHTPA